MHVQVFTRYPRRSSTAVVLPSTPYIIALTMSHDSQMILQCYCTTIRWTYWSGYRYYDPYVYSIGGSSRSTASGMSSEPPADVTVTCASGKIERTASRSSVTHAAYAASRERRSDTRRSLRGAEGSGWSGMATVGGHKPQQQRQQQQRPQQQQPQQQQPRQAHLLARSARAAISAGVGESG